MDQNESWPLLRGLNKLVKVRVSLLKKQNRLPLFSESPKNTNAGRVIKNW